MPRSPRDKTMSFFGRDRNPSNVKFISPTNSPTKLNSPVRDYDFGRN